MWIRNMINMDMNVHMNIKVKINTKTKINMNFYCPVLEMRMYRKSISAHEHENIEYIFESDLS
jgi:hypothetical protein